MSGDNFVENTVFVLPHEHDMNLEAFKRAAYGDGYRNGWTAGFHIAFVFYCVTAAGFVWLLIR